MRVIIAGGGEAGLEMAKHFAPAYDVVLIESNSLTAESLQGSFDGQVILGSVASAAVLKEAQITGAVLYLAVTGSDEINILSCLTAKRLGAQRAAACLRYRELYDVRHPFAAEMETIDWIISREQLAAEYLCNLITGSHAGETPCKLASGLIVSLLPPKPGFPEIAPGNAMFTAFSYMGNMVSFAAAAKQGGERIYVLTKAGESTYPKTKQVRRMCDRVLISGADYLGVLLARKLLSQPLPPVVHLYDLQESLCRKAAEEVPSCRVYQRDVANNEFWQHVFPRSTDIFTVTSHDDDNNLLAALIAKGYSVESIPVVWQVRYRQAVRTAGFSNIITPNVLAAQFLFHRVLPLPGINIVSLSGDGESLVEVLVDRAYWLNGRTPSEIRLSKGLLFAGCVRGQSFFTPDTVGKFRPDDVLLFFTSAGRTPVLFADLKMPLQRPDSRHKRRGRQV
jgi:trk system potassium uptake protein TrkA